MQLVTPVKFRKKEDLHKALIFLEEKKRIRFKQDGRLKRILINPSLFRGD
jgi:hypothetical protein